MITDTVFIHNNLRNKFCTLGNKEKASRTLLKPERSAIHTDINLLEYIKRNRTNFCLFQTILPKYGEKMEVMNVNSFFDIYLIKAVIKLKLQS